MKKSDAAIIANTIAALLLIAYIVAVSMLYVDRSQANNCARLNIRIIDSLEAGFITPTIVTSWLDSNGINPLKRNMHQLPIGKIEKLIRQQTYVDSAHVYTSMDGVCTIELSQHKPALRVNSSSGYDFYVDRQIEILPTRSEYVAEVPIVTGEVTFDFSNSFYGRLDEKNTKKDKVFLENLINFVDFITDDDFLCPLVTQIYVGKLRDIELIPRVGSQKIIVGQIDDYPKKLQKLKKFYLQSFDNGWWQTAQKVDIQYQNQVILTN